MNLKNILIKIIIFTMIFPQYVSAEYSIRIPLDQTGITVEDFALKGTSRLSPSVIERGESSSLIWNYPNAEEVEINGTIYPKNGSINVNPTTSTPYSLIVRKGEKEKTETLTLTVVQPNVNYTFNASKYRIGLGESATITWNVNNAQKVDITGIGNDLAFSGSQVVSPTTSTTYTLTANGFEGVSSVTNSFLIEVVPNSTIDSFTADKTNISKGENVTFSWSTTDSQSLSLEPYGFVGPSSGSQIVNFPNSGSFSYKLESTNFNGTKTESSPISINVFDNPIIDNFYVNGLDFNIYTQPNENLEFSWFTQNATAFKLNGVDITGNATTLSANSSFGVYPYTLTAFNGAGTSVSRTLNVNVVAPASITSFTSPNNVFINEPFSFNWSGNAIRYTLYSDNLNSGIPTSELDLGSSLTTDSTPLTAGTYNYTLTAYNEGNQSVSSLKSVIVEDLPTFTGFTVNGSNNISVSPNTALTFNGSGFSSGATLVGRNSTNTNDSTLPNESPSVAGNYTYYAAATKTLNSVTKHSALRNVNVNVIADSVFDTVSSPSPVFANAAFTMSYSASDAVNYKIRGNIAASGVSTTDVDLGVATSTSITPTAAGTYTYTITATNSVGTTTTTTRNVTVEANPTFTGFTVNGSTNINVAPSATLTFAGAGFSAGATLQGRDSGNTTNATLPTTAPASAGTYTYYAAATKSLNSVSRYSALRNVVVNVIDAPVFGAVTAPSNVFANAAFTMSYSASDAVNYKIRGNVAASGVSTTDVDLGTATSTNITPTAAGTYTYTITATNSAGTTTTATRNVTVEANPTFTGFTVNGGTNINVAPSAALTFAGAGFSTGATLQGRDSGNTTNATLPATAPATAGTYTYYAAATKSLNSVSRYSAVRNVVVNVINAPVFGAITAPSTVFANAAFTMTYSASDAVNYKIRGNVAASGISTTDVDLGTATTTNITPTAAGTYTYTITATNSAGTTTNTTRNVTVEANPTFTGFTVNGGTNINVAPSTALTFAGTGFSSGATLQGRDSGNTTNATLPTTAPASAGTYTYYAAATKSLNSVSRYSALRNVVVNVINAPVFGAITAPSNVFANAAFTMSYSASDAVNYKIRGNVAASGVSTTDVDLGTATTTNITPTAAGSYTYTITATNAAGTTTTTTRNVTVEANPTFTGFTVNGGTNINVATSSTLTFAGAGFSSGASLQGRDSGNTTNATLPTTAPSTAGTYTYYGAATKTLNSVSRYSSLRSVVVNVMPDPVFSSATAPSPVFANAAFTMNYSASDAVNYKIRSNAAASGISTTDVDLGTATSTNITPTAAGSYTYTITATNSVGGTTTITVNVTVESDPTISAVRINSTATFVNVANGAALTPTATVSSGATLVENVPANASANPGETTYTFYSTKTLNGITRTSANSTIVVGAGVRYTMVVGRYDATGGGYDGYGYANQAATGWTPYSGQNGSISPGSYSSNTFFGFFTTSTNTTTVNLTFSINAVDGFMINKKINIAGLACNQTGTAYNGFVDLYKYDSCLINFHNKIGQTLEIYIQN
jgi:hypothetical protein